MLFRSPTQVSVLERIIEDHGTLHAEAIISPLAAMQIVPKIAGDQTGLALLDSQHYVVAFVPLSPIQAAVLKNTGRMDNLYRALSVANASRAMLYDPRNEFEKSTFQNLGTFLSGVDIDLMDVLQGKGEGFMSVSERGGDMTSREGVFYSKAGTPAKGSSVAQVTAWLTSQKRLNELVKAGKVQVRKNIGELSEAELQGGEVLSSGKEIPSHFQVTPNLNRSNSTNIISDFNAIHSLIKEDNQFINQLAALLSKTKPVSVDNAHNITGSNANTISNVNTIKSLMKQTEDFIDMFGRRHGSVNAVSFKKTASGVALDAKYSSDLLEIQTLVSKGLDALSVEDNRMMMSRMASAIHNDKIRDVVIKGIMVDMVNVLSREQLSSNRLFNNISMLKDINSINTKSSITTIGDTTFPDFINLFTVNGAIKSFKRLDFIRPAIDRIATSGTIDKHAINSDKVDNVLGGGVAETTLSPSIISQLGFVEALYNNKLDRIYLFADNITQESLPILLSHELFHRAKATDPKTQAILKQFDSDMQRQFDLAAKGLGSKAELEAYRRVIAAETPAVNQLEEWQAYLTKQFSQNPDSLTGKIKQIISRFFAQIRMILLRNGLDFGMVRKLSPQDLWAIAGYGAQVKTNARESSTWSQNGVLASAFAPDTVRPDYKGEYFHGDSDVNKVVYGSGSIIKNPTRGTALKMAEKDYNNELRCIVDTRTGNLYIAKASGTLHEDMIRNAGLPKDATYSRYDKLNIPEDAVYGYPRNIFSDDVASPLYSKQGGLPTTLKINGIERPTTNSEGKPIAQTEAAVRNFWAWFGDSKVVDKKGRPLVVFHGSEKDFTEFNSNLGGGLIYFAERNNVGMSYGSKTISAYLKAGNILDLTDDVMADKVIREIVPDADTDVGIGYLETIMAIEYSREETREWAEKHGYDGIKLPTTESRESMANGGNAYIVFNPNQIKSATGNTGAFSPTNNDIRYSIRADYTPEAENTEPHTPEVDTWLSKWLNRANADTAIYNLQDRYIDLYRQMQKITKQGGVITESENARMGEEVSHQRIQSRINEFYDTQFNPILKALHDNKLDMDAFQTVLQARHAPSRNEVMAERNPNQEIIDEKLADAERSLEDAATNKAKQEASTEIAKWSRAKPFKGTEEERLSLSGMTDEQAQTVLDELTPEQSRVMLPLADKIDAINNDTLDLMVDYGMETPKSIQALKDQWEHYVPLHRDEAHPDDANFGHPIGRGYSIRGTGLKTATGSNAEVTNIMAHIAAAREQMLRRGEKNKVTVQLAEFITNHPDPNFAVTQPLPTQDYLVNGLVETLPDPTFKDKNNVIVYRLNGKDKALIFNEYVPENVRLAMALKNLNGIELDKVESLIAKGTRWLASVNTQYNVIFGIMNVTRDVQGAMLNLSSTPLAGKQRSVLSKMGDSIKIIAGVERGWAHTDPALKAMYERFNKAGGTTAYSQMFEGVKDRDHAIRNELKKLGEGKAMHMGRAVVKALSDFNTVMENGTRLAVFMTGVESGLSDMQAASIAKNITVNFNRKGAYTTKVGSLYAFFNASMQGSFRMAETLKGPKGKQILIGGVGLGAALTLLGIAAMGADDWDKIPEFIRERSLIIPAPWNSAGYIAIPMPLGFHILPNIGRKFVESMLGSNRISPTKRFAQLASTSISAFNPLGGSDISGLLMPTVLDPALALWRNEDWTGKTVYQQDFNSLDPTPGFSRAKNTATTPAKWAAKAANTLTGGTDYIPGLWSPTPDQIDYVVGQITGGTGRELLKAQEAVASIGSEEELPTYKIPLIGRLYGTVTGDAAERSAYYENVKLLNTYHNEVEGLRKEPGGYAKAQQYLQDNPVAKVYNRAHMIQRMIDSLKKRPGNERRISELMKKQNGMVQEAYR